MEQNNEVVVDRAKSQWSDLWKKEDYWAIWIGFFFLIVAAWLCFGQRPALEARFNEYGTIITAEEASPSRPSNGTRPRLPRKTCRLRSSRRWLRSSPI